MTKLPRNILDEIEDLYKNLRLDPRQYPGIHIFWQGCGDSGGIEELNFLTPLGLQYVKDRGYAPPTYVPQPADTSPKDYYYTEHRPATPHSREREVVYTANMQHGMDIDQWVYNTFDLCEINDGGYAHCFIELPIGNVWGESYDYVQEEHLKVSMSYGD